MNAMLKARKHFTVAINWEERKIEQWLEQYGAYLLLDSKPDFASSRNILASLMDSVTGVAADRRRRALPRCNIDVHQAMAIEDMLYHVNKTEGAKVRQWIDVAVLYHVSGYSEEDISTKFDMTMYAVKRDKMMGILRLATRFKIGSFLTD